MISRRYWEVTIMGRLRSILLPLIAFVLTACPQKTAVWVRSGSTADHLVFDFGKTLGAKGPVDVGILRVERCASSSASSAASWVVWPTSGTVLMSEIRYGEVPQGFIAQGPAQALSAGCYSVVISGTGRATFSVDSVGSIKEPATVQ
jgi:hypothetical protein